MYKNINDDVIWIKIKTCIHIKKKLIDLIFLANKQNPKEKEKSNYFSVNQDTTYTVSISW